MQQAETSLAAINCEPVPYKGTKQAKRKEGAGGMNYFTVQPLVFRIKDTQPIQHLDSSFPKKNKIALCFFPF